MAARNRSGCVASHPFRQLSARPAGGGTYPAFRVLLLLESGVTTTRQFDQTVTLSSLEAESSTMCLRDQLRAGAAIYNDGYYHAAHDAWEARWLECEDGTDDERLLHG